MKGNFDWEKKYRSLAYRIFEENNIYICELQLPFCKMGLMPTLAHAKKVRHWENFEDSVQIIRICQQCHDFIERLGQKNVITMSEIVIKIEANRGWTILEKLKELNLI